MNQFEGILLLVGAPLVLLLAGYWLAPALGSEEPPVRLAAALLAGLGSLLLAVSIANYFVPLSGPAAWACLLPALVSLGWRQSRTLLVHDLRTIGSLRSTWISGAVLALFFTLLLWPLLNDAMIVLYDGAGNHDPFFWVVGAEHLKTHTYMQHPVFDPLQPVPSAADAVIGWWPAWGRMGAEGLLALCSSVVGLSPLKLYAYVTACLYLPWLAAGQLALRTFYAERLSLPARVTVLILSPIFIFFHRNGNLPNLLGVIMGSAAIIAVESALRTGREQLNACLAWCALLTLGLHGLYCAYSEMIPFVLLPCGLLWLRTWLPSARPTPGKSRLLVAGAVVASLLLNPASTFRAGWGFYAALLSAQAGDRWENLLERLHPAQYLPVLGTLSSRAGIWMGAWVGGLLTLLLVVGLALAWRRARDRFGGLLAFSGSIVLLGYTLATQFTYGSQKSVQFSGIFLSVLLSGAIIDALSTPADRPGISRRLAHAGAAALAAFLVFSLGMQCREMYNWSDRKVISQDWFALRAHSRQELGKAPVLVEPATFRMGFFYGMWAAYFLPDSHVYFGARGEQNGGYLRANVVREGERNIPAPAAILVSQGWADTFDANSPRILTGREYSLLRKSNRVFAISGVSPLTGVPDSVSESAAFEILPHSASNLLIELASPLQPSNPAATWHLTRKAAGTAEFNATLAGPPPWRLNIPLVAGQRNQVSINLTVYSGWPENFHPGPLSFALTVLKIESTP